MGGKNVLFVKFRFFDLLSIQILVLWVSLSRHLRTSLITGKDNAQTALLDQSISPPFLMRVDGLV